MGGFDPTKYGAVPVDQGFDPTQYGAVPVNNKDTIRPLTPIQKFEVQHPDIAAAGKALLNVFGGIGASMFQPAATVQNLATGQTSPFLQQLATPPAGAAGAAGNLAGQIGQFALPGPAEAKGAQAIREALSGVPSVIRETAALAPQVASTAAINKLQGGTATSGAIAGLVGGAAGKLAERAAPGLAESAIGIGNRSRAYEKLPGKAALEETVGLHPASVAASADAKIQVLNTHLESLASASDKPASLVPTLDYIQTKWEKAVTGRNPEMAKQLEDIYARLSTDLTGMQQPTQVSASELLGIKRNMGDMSWNPNIKPKKIAAIKKAIYGHLDQELDRVVPEGKNLNQRMSSLIEVRDAAEKKAREAGIAQRSFHRLAAHTGAMAIPGLIGYREGGMPGALAGLRLEQLAWKLP